MKKIYENPCIYEIKIPLPGNPLREMNSYLIISEGESLLMDTGFKHPLCLQILNEALDESGIDRKKMRIFVSHIHTDHMGSVSDIANDDTIIYMSEEDYSRYLQCTIPDSWKGSDDAFAREGFSRENLKAIEKTNPARKYVPDKLFKAQMIEDGQEIMVGQAKFRFIKTNGHSPGHYSLYLPEEEIMFLGDHVLYDITPNIQAWLGVKDSLGDYLDNLEKLKSIPMKMALPGHRTMSKDVYQRIEEIKEHHKIRLDATVKIITEHPGLNGEQIAAQLKWSMRGKNWAEFPLEQKWFAIGETIAHLDYLRFRDVIIKDETGECNRYYIKEQ